MTSSGNGTDKKQLADVLNRIAIGIEKQYIGKESDLEDFVRVVPASVRGRQILQGGAINPTLLEVLGYSEDTCDDHNTKKVGHVSFIPDYVCGIDQKTWMVLDLKAPGVSINGDKMADFIQSYCRALHPPAPLGVLYNGYSIRVFLNPEYPGFGKFLSLKDEPDKTKAINFYQTPIASAEASNPSELVKVLLELSSLTLSEGVASLAKKLANRFIKDVGQAAWRRQVCDQIRNALLKPTDEVIAALAEVDSLWSQLTPRPTPDQAKDAWNRQESQPITIASVESVAKQSINGLLRQRIADLHAAKGMGYTDYNLIKGLRSRAHGGNGYHLVPQGQNVPTNLYVAGVSTEDAKKIIQQLDKLLAQ